MEYTDDNVTGYISLLVWMYYETSCTVASFIAYCTYIIS